MVKFLLVMNKVHSFLLKIEATIPLVGDLHKDSINLIIQLCSLTAPGSQLAECSGEELARIKLDHLKTQPWSIRGRAT